ncbi:hypothetical protein TRVL_06498 [Trypanosoma vivax]|nr:hypothetical protein TRVL_06498 [Trypanosoma vivax]
MVEPTPGSVPQNLSDGTSSRGPPPTACSTPRTSPHTTEMFLRHHLASTDGPGYRPSCEVSSPSRALRRMNRSPVWLALPCNCALNSFASLAPVLFTRFSGQLLHFLFHNPMNRGFPRLSYHVASRSLLHIRLK